MGSACLDERKVDGLLLIGDGQEPVLERKLAPRADSLVVKQHSAPARANRLREVALVEQVFIEGRKEFLGAADVERVGHGRDAARAGAQERSRHRSEGILGIGRDHRRLASVEHHAGHGMFAQQNVELLGADRIIFAFLGLENKLTLGTLEMMLPVAVTVRVSTPVAGVPVRAMPVEMQDVVLAGMAFQVVIELLERRRAQQVDAGGELALLDQIDQRAGDRAKPDILVPIRPRNDEQDIDAVLGQRRRQGARGRDVIQPPFDAAGMRERRSRFGVTQRLPGPCQNARVVALDAQGEIGVVVAGGGFEPVTGFSSLKKGIERLLAPFSERREHALGMLGFRREGIGEKILEVPAQLLQ